MAESARNTTLTRGDDAALDHGTVERERDPLRLGGSSARV